MTNALQRATSSSAAVSARFGQWEAGWEESPSYKKVRVMVIWQKVLAVGTIVEALHFRTLRSIFFFLSRGQVS